MVRHARRLFQRTAVLEIGGDPVARKRVIADLRGDAGRRGAPPIIA